MTEPPSSFQIDSLVAAPAPLFIPYIAKWLALLAGLLDKHGEEGV